MRRLLFILFSFLLMSFGNAQVNPDTTFNTLIRTENGGWIAGDATYSIALPDGRTLWLFGDSFIGIANTDSSIASGAHMIRNCALIQENEVMTALYNGTFESPSDFVPTDDSETWFWPEHGLVENNTLKIIMSEFGPNGDTTGWNFEFRSTYVALFTYPELDWIGNTPIPYFSDNGVMYGDRVMSYGDYTYIYGRKEETGNIPYVHVARAPAGNLMGEWEFYSGVTWSADAVDSRRLTNHTVSQQFGVFEHQGKWVMITQEIWLGSKIYSLTADYPEGPWRNLTVLYDIPLPFPTQITYNSYPHPQFDEDNALLISYNSNGSFWDIFSNVELYRPSFIRVPYPLIDTTFVPTGIAPNVIENEGGSGIQIFPNPAGNSVSLQFILDESADFPIQFTDLSGRVLKTIPSQKYTMGEHTIVCDLTDFPLGVITYRIQHKMGWFIHN